ncbi:MAG: glycosyltransferase family 39 protein, partial [Acidimicrobiales bacterium]|nr:glycosyltransferase family 39 protein [Acidimicrobiales bacterium]
MPRFILVLVAAITVGGLLLRLPSFNDSLAGDEISTYYIVVGHSLGRVLSLVHSRQETTPPLFFILAWATKGLLGSPAQSIRLVSLVTGTAAIPLTFLLGLWTIGRRAALVGATSVALSPYMIFFSTEARTYMLVLFLGLLSTLSLLRALDTGRVRWWVAYAACTCAAAYSHYTVVFLLVAQLAWALWTQPQARRALVVANVAAGIAFLPWLGGLKEDLHAPNFIKAFQPFGWKAIKEDVTAWSVGHPNIENSLVPGHFAVALAVAGLALGLLGLILKLRGRSPSHWHPSPRAVLIVVLAVVPAILVVFYSWLRVDILGGGNLIASWPGLALAIGALVTYPPRPVRLAAVTLTLGAFALGGLKMISANAQR